MFPYPFLEAAYMAKMCGGSGKDPRIAALERARELGHVQFSNGWEIRVKTSDELNGYHVSGGSAYKSHSIYSELVLWACYFKNGEFMFAYPNNQYWTNIIGDFYKTDDGDIYKGYDRIAVITDDVTVTVENSTVKVNMSLDETGHYYNSDGSLSSQSEKTYSIDWRIISPTESSWTLWSNLAVLRSDHQTYINDVLDFCGLPL